MEKTTRVKDKSLSKERFLAGLKAGLPVAIGYVPIAVAFGVIARTLEIPAAIAILMSVFVFAGASQFVAIELIAAGIGGVSIILTTFFVNLRHLLMSATVAEKLPALPTRWLALLSFGITDESFSLLATSKIKTLSAFYVLGVILLPYLAWTSGTVLGVLIGGQMPSILESSMEIALYAMFLGIIVPEVKKSNPKLIVVSLALFLSSLLTWNPFLVLAEGWRIILVTAISAFIAAKLFAGDDVNA